MEARNRASFLIVSFLFFLSIWQSLVNVTTNHLHSYVNTIRDRHHGEATTIGRTSHNRSQVPGLSPSSPKNVDNTKKTLDHVPIGSANSTLQGIPLHIELFDTDEPFIRVRHHCIASIRNRQYEALGKFLEGVKHDTFLFVDPAEHSNVGDNMLTWGERVFLAQYGAGLHRPKQCKYQQARQTAQKCEVMHRLVYSRNTTVPRLAMWHGGGNWGSLYEMQVHSRRIKSFTWLLASNFTVLSMPQSLYFKSNQSMIQDSQTVRQRVVASGISDEDLYSRLILTWREQESYDQAVQLYPYAQNLLVPDIAFQLGPFTPDRSRTPVDILFLLRQDKESRVQTRNESLIQNILRNPHGEYLTFRIVDWNDRLEIFNSNDILFTQTAIKLISLGRVVVADRLHACILCYLSGIPFVYIDQITGKISKTLNVAFQSGGATCLDGEAAMWADSKGGLEEGIEAALQLLQKHKL